MIFNLINSLALPLIFIDVFPNNLVWFGFAHLFQWPPLVPDTDFLLPCPSEPR